MRKTKNISQQAESKYHFFLCAYIQNELDTFFPLIINKFSERARINDSREEQKQKLEELEDNSKLKLGFGYDIKWKPTINSKNKGEVTLPQNIYFQNTDNYLKFINKTSDFKEFKHIYALVISEMPQLKEWILKNSLELTAQKEKWIDLLKICKYFLAKHIPDNKLYIRELPIEIHTKFIEGDKKNKSKKLIISSLLNSILPKNKINQKYTGISNHNFEKRFFLNYDKTLIRFRILDKNLYINNLSDISILPNEFFKLNIDCENVLIAENLMNVLTFPKVENSIIIWGKGNRVNTIKSAKWLADKKIYYWGDIDTWGLHILSSLREHYKNAKSILMTKRIFESHKKYVVQEEKSNTQIPKNLTCEENILFNFLLSLAKEKKENRLEQEHILQTELETVLKQLE